MVENNAEKYTMTFNHTEGTLISDRFPAAEVALAALRGKWIVKSQRSQGWKRGLGVGVATVAVVAGLNHFKYPLLSAIGFTLRAMYEGIITRRKRMVGTGN